MNVVDVKRQPTIEELHEPDQTVLTVKLDASGLRKTSRKKTSTKSTKTMGKKTRGKSHAKSLEPLEIKGETIKTTGKKTSTKREKTSRKNWGLPDEELGVLRLTSNRVVEAMRRNPSITREELVSELRVTLSGINWQIAKLRKDKIIRRVGGRKFGHWEVLI